MDVRTYQYYAAVYSHCSKVVLVNLELLGVMLHTNRLCRTGGVVNRW